MSTLEPAAETFTSPSLCLPSLERGNDKTTKVWSVSAATTSVFDSRDAHLFAATGSSGGFGRSLVELILNGSGIAVATPRTPSLLNDLERAYDESRLLVLSLDITDIEQIKNVSKLPQTSAVVSTLPITSLATA